MKKNCCWVYYKWVIIQNQTLKVVLDLSNYGTKKELEHATGIDTSDLAAKKRFYCFESWNW